MALKAYPAGLTSGQISDVTGLPHARVGAYVSAMKDNEKNGERGSFVYTLKTEGG